MRGLKEVMEMNKKITEAIAKDLPKIDLHCHLDGSVSKLQIRDNLAQLGIQTTLANIQKSVVAPEWCQDLTEYLMCFDLIKKSLATSETIRLAIFDICAQALLEKVVYLELRFSPFHLTTNSFTMEEVVLSVIRSVEEAEKLWDLKIGIILCMMRGRTEAINYQVLELAKRYRKNICGIDLAGNELKYPTIMYRDLLTEAVRLQFPVTVHAGEVGTVKNIYDAIELGANRIGHGIAAFRDEKLCMILKEKQIPLELCPRCNIQTRAAKSWETYPLKPFEQKGILVTINTDNRTVSNTSLTKELLAVHQNGYPLTIQDVKRLTLNSLKASFLNPMDKKIIKDRIEHYYHELG